MTLVYAALIATLQWAHPHLSTSDTVHVAPVVSVIIGVYCIRAAVGKQ
jgi:hypothetical protein